MGIHAVIDFETTGLSPALGARPTEVAIVLIAEGKIVDRFQSLMNPGVSIPNDIQILTGITNEMVRKAPKVEVVIRDAVQFVGTHPIVAHNAAFDSKFWDAELHRINGRRKQEFACSMLLARRIFPEAPNHKLGTGACQESCRLNHAANPCLLEVVEYALTTQSRSGLSVTASMGDQFRVLLDQRFGLRSRASI